MGSHKNHFLPLSAAHPSFALLKTPLKGASKIFMKAFMERPLTNRTALRILPKYITAVFAFALLCLSQFASNIYADNSSAFALYADQKYDDARKAYLAIVQAEPGNSQAWFYLGEIEKAEKDYEKSVTYYLRAIEGSLAGKNLRSAYWSLMMTTEQQKNYPAMVRACRIYWQKTGDDSARKRIETLTNRALWSANENAVAAYNEGLAHLGNAKADEAVSSFYRAMQLDSSFLAPRFEIGMIAFKKGDNDTALQHISIVADKIFYYTSAQMAAARLYEVKNRYDKAIVHYTNVLEYGFLNANDRFEALTGRAQCNLRSDKLEQALGDITGALSIKETQSARLIQVAIFIRSRQYAEADAILQREAVKDPSNPEILYQMGSLQYLQKNNSYIEVFAKLFELYRDKPARDIPSKYQRTFQIIARDFYAQKNYASAASLFMHLPDHMMDSSDRINLARSLYYSQNYQDAMPRFERLNLTAEDRLMLIKCYRKTGDEARAYTMLKPIVLAAADSALDRDPDLATLVTQIRRDEAERLRLEAEESARRQREAEEAASAQNQ